MSACIFKVLESSGFRVQRFKVLESSGFRVQIFKVLESSDLVAFNIAVNYCVTMAIPFPRKLWLLDLNRRP